jgi:hypothetical protein
MGNMEYHYPLCLEIVCFILVWHVTLFIGFIICYIKVCTFCNFCYVKTLFPPILILTRNAFDIAEKHLGIPRLLDPEDIDTAR